MYLLFLGNVHFKFDIKRYNRNLVSRYVHFKYQNVHLKIALWKSVVKMYIFKPQTVCGFLPNHLHNQTQKD